MLSCDRLNSLRALSSDALFSVASPTPILTVFFQLGDVHHIGKLMLFRQFGYDILFELFL